jgi:tetratricopeptide (TPR) repeat protein
MSRTVRLAEAWAHFDEDAFDKAITETRALWSELSAEGRHDGWLLLGLAHDATGDTAEALRCFRELCQGSENADDWCHLAVGALRAGDRELSSEALEQVRLCHQVSHYVQRPGLFLHLFFYATALLSTADREGTRALLDEIADGMRRLPSVEPALLLSRGMPTFPGLISLAVRHFRAAGTPDAGSSWLEALGEGLDPASQRQVAGAMKELRETDGK